MSGPSSVISIPKTPAIEREDGAPASFRESAPAPAEVRRLKRVEAQQEMIVELGRRAMAPADLSALLVEAAQTAARGVATSHFAVAERNPSDDFLTLRIGAIGDGLDELGESPVFDNAATSLVAAAIQKQETIIIPDLDTHNACGDAELLRLGVRSAILCPMRHGGHGFGVLCVCDVRPRLDIAKDRYFVESVAGLMSSTIARQWVEQQLEETRRGEETLLAALEAPVFTLHSSGAVRSMNEAAETITGFTVEELKNRNLWSALAPPDELDKVRAAMVQVRQSGAARFESRALSKQGSDRRLSWTLSRLREGAVIASAIDLTDMYDTLDKLRASETEAARARAALAELQLRIDEQELLFDERNEVVKRGAVERRSQTRQPYPYVQHIAPNSRFGPANAKTFRQAQCRDISPSGFSFLSPTLPDFKEIVVAFGAPPSVLYLIARIVHATPIRHEGRDVCLVGCRYVRRIA